MEAVLDPGVLIAAAITPHGVCGRVLSAALDGRYVLVASPLVLAELDEVLQRAKFRRYFSAEEARRYVALVGTIARIQPDGPPPLALSPDPDDDYLIALAQQAGVDYLVSGDPHLTGLTGCRPPIVTPAVFLNRLADQEGVADDAGP